MRESMERSSSKAKDPVQLQKRLGLFSGVALIVGTMIGKGEKSQNARTIICLHETTGIC